MSGASVARLVNTDAARLRSTVSFSINVTISNLLSRGFIIERVKHAKLRQKLKPVLGALVLFFDYRVEGI